MAKAKVDVEIAKLLTDHRIGVRGRYLDYTEDDLLQEYLKAIHFLTINEENRLKIKVRELEEKSDLIMELKLEMDKLKETMGGNSNNSMPKLKFNPLRVNTLEQV